MRKVRVSQSALAMTANSAARVCCLSRVRSGEAVRLMGEVLKGDDIPQGDDVDAVIDVRGDREEQVQGRRMKKLCG